MTGYKSYLLFATLYLSACASSILGYSDFCLYFSLISFSLFFAYLGRLFFSSPFYFFFFLPFIFNYLWFSFSSVLFEFGAYTSELRLSGTPDGAGARLTFFLFLLISVSKFTFDYFQKKIVFGSFSKTTKYSVLLMYFVILMSILAIYFMFSSAIFLGIDRIEYRREVAPGVFFYLLNASAFFLFFVGVVRESMRREGGRTLWCDSLFFTGLILMVLAGEKFSMLFTAVSLYATPYFYEKNILFSLRYALRFFGILILLLALIVGLAFNQYASIGVHDDLLTFGLNLTLDRIVQQSQLNFYFDRLVFLERNSGLGFFDFLYREVFPSSNSNPVGISRLMSIAMPRELYSIYYDTGVTLGDGFPAILYDYFGWGVVFLMPFLGALLGAGMALIFYFGFSLNLPVGLGLFFALYNTFLSFYLNGEIYLLFKPTIGKLVAILFLLFHFAIKFFQHSACQRD